MIRLMMKMKYASEAAHGLVTFTGDGSGREGDPTCETLAMWVDDWGELGSPRTIWVTIDKEDPNG